MLWTSVSSVSKIRPDNGNYRTLNLPQGGQQVQAAVELVALAPDVILATGSASLGPLLTGHSQRADRFCDRPRSGWRGIRGQSRQARLLRRPLRGLAGALTLSPVPEGFARWSLRLLEEKVVELHIVERASDNTIGRTLKKTFSSRIASSNG